MANGTVSTIDAPDDIYETVIAEEMDAHGLLMAETAANIQHSHNIARNVGIKQYHQVDPIESAAASVILRIKPLVK